MSPRRFSLQSQRSKRNGVPTVRGCQFVGLPPLASSPV
uniref:Uncharacterized protein n=1 Tax=Arundo donax TaxID=35708 RepID=A0A0A8ZSR4_ARUDO